MNEINAVLKKNDKKYPIIAKIHKRNILEDYQLDPINFYQKWRGKKPEGIGYEIEVLNHDELNLLHKEMNRSLDSEGRLISLNIHKGNDDKIYVCYTPHINSFEEAIGVFKNWSCVVYSQIFLGLTYQQLGKEIDSNNFIKISEYAEKKLNKEKLILDYSRQKEWIEFTELLKKESDIIDSLFPDNNDPIVKYFVKFNLKLQLSNFEKMAIHYKNVIDTTEDSTDEDRNNQLYKTAKSFEYTQEEKDAFENFQNKLREAKKINSRIQELINNN